MKKYLKGRLEIVLGDITGMEVDAIVNAANSSLLGGGGVDGAIHAAGGGAILKECRVIRESVYPKGMPAGNAVITTGGNLPAPFVIHTVGPVWHGGNKMERETLYDSYFNSLMLAGKKNLRSIAFPALSTGVYGYPKKSAAETAYTAIRDFTLKNSLPETVTLVFFSKNDAEVFISVVDRIEQ